MITSSFNMEGNQNYYYMRQKISEPFTTVFPANTILDKGFTSQPLTVMLPP